MQVNSNIIFLCVHNVLHKSHVKELLKYVHNVHTTINPLMPNDPYRGRTGLLTSKHCILYIYSTNIGTEYFKHGIYSPFFSLPKYSLFHNSNIFSSCIIHILYTGCAKIKKSNSGTKRLISNHCL